MRKFAERFCEGDLPKAGEFAPFVDTSSFPNARLLIEQASRKERGEHFHCYALFGEVMGATKLQGLVNWFPWFIEEPWRFSSVSGEIAQILLHPGNEDLCRRYLEAALEFGEEFENEGQRFKTLSTSAHFSTSPTGAALLLHDLGASFEVEKNGELFVALRKYLT